MPLILGTNSIKDTGFDVANSLRFEDGSNDFLNRTPSSSGNRKTWTLSTWIKRSELGRTQNFFSAGSGGNYNRIQFNSNDTIYIAHVDSGSTTTEKSTTQVFRDISAWMHIVWHIDTTQGTASNREKFYINGVQVTDFSTNTIPAQDYQSTINENVAHYIGNQVGAYEKCSCYFAEVVFIDGQALDPTSFGEFDEDSPTIWKPKDVSGLTFGTNGFYLDFEDSSALGNDAAGSNNFTVNNLTAIDQTTDTCTNNFCTVNSLDNYHQQATLSEGNTKITFKGPSSYYAYSTGTFGVANGKWYWETKATSAGNHNVYGISGRYVIAYNKGLGVNTDEYGYYNYNGNYTNASSDGSYAENSFSGGNVTWTTNDIIGIALDLDSGTNTVKFYKNNALIGTVNIIAPSSGFYYPAWNQFDNQAEVCQPNFGNPSYSVSSPQSDANGFGSFSYAPPSGYFALCSKNLAEYGG